MGSETEAKPFSGHAFVAQAIQADSRFAHPTGPKDADAAEAAKWWGEVGKG